MDLCMALDRLSLFEVVQQHTKVLKMSLLPSLFYLS